MLLLIGAVRAQSVLDCQAKIVALVFVSSECPISNRMAPEIELLSKKYPTNDVALFVVYPNPSDSAELIDKHRREYRLTGPFLRDPRHELVRKAGVKVTPEAAVFDEKRSVVYRGRINDQFLSLGKARFAPGTHDLRDALDAVLAGRVPKPSVTKAIGCYIEGP